ncbi:MAG: homoserine kinase [Rhodanobacter sp. SCN 67-45]|nr:MAG: homoserine kinase [Rhodanobacter sp. SCN 67-45]
MNTPLQEPLMAAHARPPHLAHAFAPASVGNVGVGFDLLGHSVAGAGDRAEVRRIEEPVVRIAAIRGCVEGLPLDPRHNTAGTALLSLHRALKLPFGFELVLHKGIALGSGMGGSAASCVAALVAANALLEQPLSREALYPFALDGEAVASGSRHGDNLGSMLLGGLVLATHERLVRIAVPAAWHCALVHPHVVLETRRARAALAGHYELGEFVAQSSNLALVLTGCQRGDATLVREGLKDVLVEPRRAPLIPHFAQVKQAALDHHALGASISGAGPSVFGWYDNRADAEAASVAMQAAFADAGLDSDAWVSPINGPAAELMDSLDQDSQP